MNCIDGIEGVAKKVIEELHRIFREQGCDDTEFVRCLRAVVDGTDGFVQENREVVSDPELLRRELYNFAKTLWLSARITDAETAEADPESDDEYYGYYFDRIYHQQEYPL